MLQPLDLGVLPLVAADLLAKPSVEAIQSLAVSVDPALRCAAGLRELELQRVDLVGRLVDGGQDPRREDAEQRNAAEQDPAIGLDAEAVLVAVAVSVRVGHQTTSNNCARTPYIWPLPLK